MTCAVGPQSLFDLNLNLNRMKAAVVAGALAQARACSEGALALSGAHTASGDEAWSLYLLSAINAGEEPASLAVAEDHYRRGLARAGELSMRPLVAHCHLGLGKLYGRVGKREEGQEHLTTATTMYREMHMRFWLQQTEAEMRALG
jgi:hypothetical protein